MLNDQIKNPAGEGGAKVKTTHKYTTNVSGCQVSRFYSFDELREKADCLQLAADLGLKLQGDRCQAVWRGGDGFNVSLSASGWIDHVSDEKGDAVGLVALVQGVDRQTAQQWLGDRLGLAPTKMLKQDAVERVPRVKLEDAKGRKYTLHPTLESLVEGQLFGLKQNTGKSFRHNGTWHYNNPEAVVLRFDTAGDDHHASGKQYRPAHQVEHEGKTYWRSGDPVGKWSLYRLGDIADSEEIHVFEGEKAADAAAALGFPATTSAHGAKSARKTDWKPLKGKRVVIFPDADTAGADYASDVAQVALIVGAISVHIAKLPGAETGDDIVDYVKKCQAFTNATDEQLAVDVQAVIDAAPEWQATTKEPKTDDQRSGTSPENGKKGGRPKGMCFADVADEIAADSAVGGVATIRTHRGMWFRFQGNCYRPMSRDDAKSIAMQFLRLNYRDDATRNTVDNVLANLASVDLCGLLSSVDVPSWINAGGGESASGWLPMGNAIVNVAGLADRIGGKDVPDDGVIRELTPRLFSTFAVDYDFQADAKCPKFEKFISEVMPEPEGRKCLQMLCGLALIPETAYNVAFLLYGEGGCGKSTFLGILEGLVGKANICCVPLANFTDRFTTWMLTTHLLNIVGDLPTEVDGNSLHNIEGAFKDACDGGIVPVEHKYQDKTEGHVIARSIFAGNSLPRFSDRSLALWDRLRILPFSQRFRDTPEENRYLRQDIVADELPGVFMWAVQGLAMLKASERFPEHPEGEAIKDLHRGACDIERGYLLENYEPGDVDDYIESQDAYAKFREWLMDTGHRTRTESTFSEAFHRVFNRRKERRRVAGVKTLIYPKVKRRI